MSSEGHLTLLQRLDLALASSFALRGGVDLDDPEGATDPRLAPDREADSLWITRVLALRGFRVRRSEVAAIVDGTASDRTDQEFHLTRGMADVLQTIREHAARGRSPDGWAGVELFRLLTANIARFRKNAIRKDLPWDGIAPLRYPDSDELPALLEGFCAAQHYQEEPEAFEELHPVRQAVRVLWRFARIAPFPDLNLVMAFVQMNAYLLAKGYPMVTPTPKDRTLLNQLVVGPPPRRLVQFESRLVKLVGA